MRNFLPLPEASWETPKSVLRRCEVNIRTIILALCAAAPLSATAQDTLTVMTWNLLNYNPSNTVATNRHQYYRKVIDAVNPDIVVFCEVAPLTPDPVLQLLNNVMNVSQPGEYSPVKFAGSTGKDSYNLMFYRTGKVTVPANIVHSTAVRDINQFVVVNSATNDTLRIFGVHLKAGNTATDAATRGTEVDVLRGVTNSFPAGKNFLVLGDFNIYNSAEPAYLKLKSTSGGVEGYFLDPVTMPYPTTWDNSANQIHHTQSTRSSEVLPDGGSTGGLDDRFDMILHSQAVADPGGIRFIAGSYVPYGNSGNLWNKSVTDIANTAYPDSIKTALYYASDHLPVVAKYLCTGPNSVERISTTPSGFRLEQNYPNPFNPSTRIRFSLEKRSEIKLTISDILGRNVAVVAEGTFDAGTYEGMWDGKDAPSGVYLLRLETGGASLSRKIVLLK